MPRTSEPEVLSQTLKITEGDWPDKPEGVKIESSFGSKRQLILTQAEWKALEDYFWGTFVYDYADASTVIQKLHEQAHPEGTTYAENCREDGCIDY